MPYPISRLVREKIIAQLAHPEMGFQVRFDEALTDAGLTVPSYWKLPIAFGFGGSLNFFTEDLTPDDLDETTTITFPLVTLSAQGARNTNWQKFGLFSGQLSFQLAFHLLSKTAKATGQLERLMDLIEEAVYSTFNSTDASRAGWSQPAVWTGDIAVRRSPLIQNGQEEWRKSLVCQLSFHLDRR